MRLPRQCAILVGGYGTRLGRLTDHVPKPLLDSGGRPFLAWLIRELCRYGFEEVVLLAGHRADAMTEFAQNVSTLLPRPITIRISIEHGVAGTGGAIYQAASFLDHTFLLMNGDSWLDTPLAPFIATAYGHPGALGHVLLRKMERPSRYGIVELRGNYITSFHERLEEAESGLINAGVYLFNKRALAYMSPSCSLEKDVLPQLAKVGLLRGVVASGTFIDIGVPDDYVRSKSELPERFRRPAIFFDRDGVLNKDHGWVGSRDRFEWLPGALEAIKGVNAAGYHAFLVTNQAGVARGLYSERDVLALQQCIEDELLASGASLDDFRYCPFHSEAVLSEYKCDTSMRKPGPGMISDLLRRWEVALPGTKMIGDKGTDIEAARAAQIDGCLYESGPLNEYVRRFLPVRSSE